MKKKLQQFKAIDFFCGGGGMTCGLRQAGIDVIAGVDIDKEAKATYEHNNKGTVFVEKDIRRVHSDYFERNFGIQKNDDKLILVGCSPCQFYSIINTDKESSLKTKDLLQYKYHDAYVIQASSTDIGMSWRKFKVRAKQLPPERYCNYVLKSGGTLKVYNTDSKDMDDVAEADWHEARPVFFEDHKYNLTLTFFDAVEEPRIIHPNKEVEAMFNMVKTASGEYVISSSLDFLNQPGHFALEFAYKNTANEHIQHKIEFDVLSPKLDTKHDLDIIIQQIRAEYGDLVFRYLTLTFQQFEMGREANNELIWLSVFKQIVDSYVQAVRFIIHQPHNKMRQYEEYRRAERIKGWTPMLAERFSNDRLNDEEQALRKYYRTEQTEATLDTRENRFVKYTLQRITERLSLLMQRLGDGTSDSEIENLKEKQKELEMLRRNSFFNSIGHFDGFRQQSMVLQQRSGYSQVYRYWIMLQNGLDLIQGDTSVGVQPIWRLYELWCFLKLKQLVCKVLGIDVHNKEHLEKYVHEDTQNAFDLFNGGTLSGHITYTNPQNEDLVEVGYQYSFDRKGDEHEMRSATTEQKPDIVMHIHKNERDITLTYLYDAKYSVRGDDDATLGGNVQDEPKPETINAMHHYRDAIYYGKRGEQRFSKEIIGGYILFPGRMNEQRLLEQLQDHDEQLPYFLKSIEEVNIGAYPLLPNEESGLLLENHLRKVLLNESIIEQLEMSVPQRGLYYTDTQPKSVESKNVFTVTVRKTDADYQTFLEHKAKKYVMETLPKVNILEAVYLLPMVGGDIDGYYKITRLTIEDGKMCLKLGEFVSLGNEWVNIFQNMRHGELITMNNVLKLYGQRY